MSSGGRISSTTAVMKKQSFIATEGQVLFTVTTFTLTDAFIIMVNDTKQAGVVRAGQDLTLPMGAPEGSLIEVWN
ncbi:MAG: hypothetical protein WCK09_17620 [Bacteroidota bacterium]